MVALLEDVIDPAEKFKKMERLASKAKRNIALTALLRRVL